MNTDLTMIIDYISKFVDYINSFTVDCVEKQNAVTRLEDAVFGLTYLNEED